MSLEGADRNDSPREINFTEFVESRSKEMEMMMRSAGAVKENQRTMQQLPRLMRRRAASHDVRRLPLKLRLAAQREMNKTGPPAATKRPSRKYRRRPRNLLNDYARRKRKHVWLETHIWHAKRFHMINRWGCRIPLFSNDRGVRAAYRSVANRCLIADTSYYCCIELIGAEQELIKGFDRITNSATGSTLSSPLFRSGTREGSTVIYAIDSYPKLCIGEATFIWNPSLVTASNGLQTDCSSTTSEANESIKRWKNISMPQVNARQLWIWCHPSIYHRVLNEIKAVFQVKLVNGSELSEKISDKLEQDGGSKQDKTNPDINDQLQPLPRAVYSNGSVTVESLKDDLCRFKLIGSRSLAVLQSVLQTANVAENKDKSISASSSDKLDEEKSESEAVEQMDISTPDTHKRAIDWWTTFCMSEQNLKYHSAQVENWNKLSGVCSPAELPPHCVTGLTVRDPRLFLPAKKLLEQTNSAKDLQRDVHLISMAQLSLECCQSPLWCREIREEVKSTKLTTTQLNDVRSKCIVPENVLRLDSENSIPVLLIQNPGVRQTSSSDTSIPGYGCGFDLIIPAGWATAFWISLIYRTAMAGGCRELCGIELETGRLQFPSGYPDTEAGKEQGLVSYSERAAKYNRMPPSKRCNYAKLGIAAPYHFPWQELVREWMIRMNVLDESNFVEQFYCIRDVNFLRDLDRKCNPSAKRPRIIRKSLPSNSIQAQAISSVASYDYNRDPCLVPVCIEMLSRGLPTQQAIICVPHADDLKSNGSEPVEPKHNCTGSRKVRKIKLKLDCFGNKIDGLEKNKTEHIVKSKAVLSDVTSKDVISELKPNEVKNCLDSCSRFVIGYIVDGGFSYSRSCGVGLGFVSLHGLQHLLQKQSVGKRLRVLIRTTTSMQYRNAMLSVTSS